jgi:hypothetical protein
LPGDSIANELSSVLPGWHISNFSFHNLSEIRWEMECFLFKLYRREEIILNSANYQKIWNTFMVELFCVKTFSSKVFVYLQKITEIHQFWNNKYFEMAWIFSPFWIFPASFVQTLFWGSIIFSSDIWKVNILSQRNLLSITKFENY